ncbi:hypothetical protein [Sinorhizobium fredii]|uniref:hypothetical protein n=1 Tax=Rhizobium fredii TaxID=380 RepID=UPI003395B180
MIALKWHAYLCGTAAVSFLAVATDNAVADAQKARLGMVMSIAFECGTYADMAGDKERMQALYKHGIETGRKFVKALRANEITPQELREHVPVGVTLRLGGDSDDIMIGRILEGAIENAYDKVVKQDSSGMPLESSKWVNDDSLRKTIAQNKYQLSNCDLVQ